MTVEAVADIFPVGNLLDNTVLFPKLLDLKATQIFRRSSVNSIQTVILFLKLLDHLIDMNECSKCEGTILHQGFLVMQLFQLIECGKSKRRRRTVKQRSDLIMNSQMAA